jgi:hypothetical protein
MSTSVRSAAGPRLGHEAAASADAAATPAAGCAADILPAADVPALPRRRAVAGKIARAARRPPNVERLARLRRELARIPEPPCDPEQARAEILKAMGRAGLSDWSVPELDDASSLRCGDGSVVLRLISHSVILNAWGAFRIVDLLAPAVPYFELHGKDRRPFAPPPGSA